jgi:hypothetical protein
MEALVAASRFGETRNQKDLLKIAAELYKDLKQTDSKAMIVHRNSVLLRLCRKISEPQRVIQEFLDRPLTQPNPRLHSLLGLDFYTYLKPRIGPISPITKRCKMLESQGKWCTKKVTNRRFRYIVVSV